MKGKSAAAAAFLAVSLRVFAVTVSDLIVSGVAESERERVEALLPIKKGASFASMEDLRRFLRFSQSYLEQGGEYAGVEIEAEEIDDRETEVFVFLRPPSIAGTGVLGSTMTVIPNFPAYGIGFGFAAGTSEQLLGIVVPLFRWFSLDFAGGHAQSADGVHAIAGKAGFDLKPLPLLTLHSFAAVDAFPQWESAWTMDMALQAGGRFNLEFLEDLILFGLKAEGSFRAGLGDFSYTAWRAKASLTFRPFDFLSASAAAGLYSVAGNASALTSAVEAGTRDLRVRPTGLEAAHGVAAASLAGEVVLPLKANLGVTSLAPSLFCCVEASSPFEDPFALQPETFAPSLAGGVVLAFSPPFSFVFEVGWGYCPQDGRSVFLFSMR